VAANGNGNGEEVSKPFLPFTEGFNGTLGNSSPNSCLFSVGTVIKPSLVFRPRRELYPWQFYL
jgi:hypothetical protein